MPSSARCWVSSFPSTSCSEADTAIARIKQAGYLAGVVAPMALAASQMWAAHEETERARIEAERALSCETDYREAMSDLYRKIEALKEDGP